MIIPAGFDQINAFFIGPAVPRGGQIVFGVDNSASSLTPTTIAGLVGANLVTNILPLMTEDCTLDKVRCKEGPNATGPEATVDFGVPGSITSNALPPQVTLLSRKVCALGGHKHQGRTNWPGLTEDDTNGAGTWIPATLTAWDGGLSDFLTQLASDDIPMVLLHSDATTPDPVLGYSVEKQCATQKRRNRRTR